VITKADYGIVTNRSK